MHFNKGHLTSMQRTFVKEHVRTGDAVAAAWRTGYKSPDVAASLMKRNPKIQAAIRQETQRFLYEEAGGIAIGVLVGIALDKKSPAGARVKSASELARLSNIAISDQLAGKPDHELTASELDALRKRLEAQRQAVESVLSTIPTAVIENDGVLA